MMYEENKYDGTVKVEKMSYKPLPMVMDWFTFKHM